jgi:hypothetical protein
LGCKRSNANTPIEIERISSDEQCASAPFNDVFEGILQFAIWVDFDDNHSFFFIEFSFRLRAFRGLPPRRLWCCLAPTLAAFGNVLKLNALYRDYEIDACKIMARPIKD